jgi:protein-disulfide isomerase
MNRKTLFISVAGLLVLAFGVAVFVYQDQQNASEMSQTAQRQGAPIKGPKDAKVTIVEFFDPACGTCRDFYPRVKKLIDKYPGKVRVMMRYAPLHRGSDQVVKLLEAARLQGKFWQALESLFASQGSWVVGHVSQPMRALAALGSIGLDREKFSADMKRPEVAQVIERDVLDGKALNVRATPEFFVNGRPLPSFGFDQLSRLVKEAVSDAY